MTDPDAAGGGGEYQVVVGKSPSFRSYNHSSTLSGPDPRASPHLHTLAIPRANCQDSDGQTA